MRCLENLLLLKLRGKAQRVADRNRVTALSALSESLRTSFEQLKLDYERLAKDNTITRRRISKLKIIETGTPPISRLLVLMRQTKRY